MGNEVCQFLQHAQHESSPEVCDIRESCPEIHCSQVVAEVKADIDRNRIIERLQMLEAWKLDADKAELSFIAVHEDYLKYLLDPGSIPHDKYDSIAWTSAVQSREEDPQ